MDPLDKALLWELFGDARVSFQDLAKKYNQSFNTIKNRVKKLEKAGVIQEYTIELSMAMLDLEPLLILIKTDGSENTNALMDQIGSQHQVRYVYRSGSNRYAGAAFVTGTTEFFELKHNLESVPAVQKVDIHPIFTFVPDAPPDSKVRSRGQKVTFSYNQLRVLQCLCHDVRMSIGDIAKHTDLTPRRVSKILHELREGGGVHFTMRMNYLALGDVELEYIIRYDDLKTSPKEIIEWIYLRYSGEFWHASTFLDEPTVIVTLLTNDPTQIEEITNQIREIPNVRAVTDYLIPQQYRGGHYRDPTQHRLDEMLKDVGLME
ncbi:MAG: winged helix-turn-helix transcriptional regulator [Promethearchaeota archaeon]